MGVRDPSQRVSLSLCQAALRVHADREPFTTAVMTLDASQQQERRCCTKAFSPASHQQGALLH